MSIVPRRMGLATHPTPASPLACQCQILLSRLLQIQNSIIELLPCSLATRMSRSGLLLMQGLYLAAFEATHRASSFVVPGSIGSPRTPCPAHAFPHSDIPLYDCILPSSSATVHVREATTGVHPIIFQPSTIPASPICLHSKIVRSRS